MPEVMLTVRDLCERYRVSRSTFYREANAGRIRLVKLGRMTRVHVDDAHEWAARVFVEAASLGGEA
jgi:excisionase family DNA binding protein